MVEQMLGHVEKEELAGDLHGLVVGRNGFVDDGVQEENVAVQTVAPGTLVESIAARDARGHGVSGVGVFPDMVQAVAVDVWVERAPSMMFSAAPVGTRAPVDFRALWHLAVELA